MAYVIRKLTPENLNHFNKNHSNLAQDYINYICKQEKKFNNMKLKYPKKHSLGNEDSNYKLITSSASTIFYNLDEIAKKHSLQYLTDLYKSNTNVLYDTYAEKYNLIVQDCATQVYSKLIKRGVDKNMTNRKKRKLSYEVIAKDNYLDCVKTFYNPRKQRKIRSVSKYFTELNKQRSKRMKYIKNDSFPYLCADNKSPKESVKKPFNKNKIKRQNKNNSLKENKSTTTTSAKLIDVMTPLDETIVVMEDNKNKEYNVSQCVSDENKNSQNIQECNPIKPSKVIQNIICPKCNEKMNTGITNNLATAEEEGDNMRHEKSMSNIDEIPLKTAKTYVTLSASGTRSSLINVECYTSSPSCEVLQKNNPEYDIYKKNSCNSANQILKKSMPCIIQTTKTCEYYPLCADVPSCQIKNNWNRVPQYCLHPPKCVSSSKSFHNKETISKLVNDSNGKNQSSSISEDEKRDVKVEDGSVIFIRDVGCQICDATNSFESYVKDHGTVNSLVNFIYKNSFDFAKVMDTSDYSSTQIHEEPIPDPILEIEQLQNSLSMVSITSIGSKPTTEEQNNEQKSSHQLQSSYARSATKADDLTINVELKKSASKDFQACQDNLEMKPRRSFFKDKCSNIMKISIKRRRKGIPNNQKHIRAQVTKKNLKSVFYI